MGRWYRGWSARQSCRGNRDWYACFDKRTSTTLRLQFRRPWFAPLWPGRRGRQAKFEPAADQGGIQCFHFLQFAKPVGDGSLHLWHEGGGRFMSWIWMRISLAAAADDEARRWPRDRREGGPGRRAARQLPLNRAGRFGRPATDERAASCLRDCGLGIGPRFRKDITCQWRWVWDTFATVHRHLNQQPHTL